ncbi:MAG: sigma-54-dependent Fis family transcriptional regulator [Ignavibacteriales bacterium]|nr:sigma-54-dependent Fis family transcriptional regulator [Ignavibacteriales bacterium]
MVDDDEDVLLAAKLLLKSKVGLIHTEKNPKLIPQILKNESYDVIFLDMNFTDDMTSGKEGFFWLNEILKIDPSAVVILITAYGDVETAVKAVKEGAIDFVLKPWQNEKFLATLAAALKLRESKVLINNLRSREKIISEGIDQNFHELVGISPGIRQVFQTIKKVANTDANVLILGENGTGKELVARAFHRQSQRSDEAFISVDMGAITKSLFETELFGHVKGAFTDAKEERAGRFEIASGGTLFLDEIGNIPLELQAKLLTVLQKREVARVGSNKYKPIDIRLICATNSSIQQLVDTALFRQDLLYRINTVEIEIPPLRERLEDIELLSEHFLSIYKRKYNKPDLRINPKMFKRFELYNWPGNVRELQHTIERCVILSDGNTIQPSEFIFHERENNDINDGLVFDSYNLEEIERMIIRRVINKHDGNITKAASELGLTRTSLYRRMEKHGL